MDDDLAMARLAVRCALGETVPVTFRSINNTNNAIYIITRGAKSFALKLFRDNDSGFAAEVRLRKWIGDAVKVPPIASAGELPDGSKYLLLDWIEGRPLSRILLDQTRYDGVAVFRQLGQVTAVLQSHALPPDAPWPRAPQVLLRYGEAGTRFADEIAALTAPLAHRLGDGPHRSLMDCLAVVSAEAEPTAPVLCHADYRPKNVLVGEEDALSAIVDWEFTRIGNPWADVSQMLRFAPDDAQEDALGAGYFAGRLMPGNWKRVARGFDLARIAVGLLSAKTSDSDYDDWFGLLSGLGRFLREGDARAIRSSAWRLLDI